MRAHNDRLPRSTIIKCTELSLFAVCHADSVIMLRMLPRGNFDGVTRMTLGDEPYVINEPKFRVEFQVRARGVCCVLCLRV